MRYLLILLLSITLNASENFCRIPTKLILLNDKFELSLCGGEHSLDFKKLSQWQGCSDATILLKDKASGKVSVVSECDTMIGKDVKLINDTFFTMHQYQVYPGFTSIPLLEEKVNLFTKQKSYKFIVKVSKCFNKDIKIAKDRIDAANKRPFGKTYFKELYEGLFKLRDCSFTYHNEVLSILNNYHKNNSFGVSPSELLGQIIDEVVLIKQAKESKLTP